MGALAINLTCACMLAAPRRRGGSLTRAAFPVGARNDTFANLAIIGTGLVTGLLWRLACPDLIVGLGITIMNADAAREVWEAAVEERRTAES